MCIREMAKQGSEGDERLEPQPGTISTEHSRVLSDMTFGDDSAFDWVSTIHFRLVC
jgi:hypothetical protein